MCRIGMELLAPAGGPEALRAAVQSGADAVYLGAGSFSARAGAENFSFEELSDAVRYCHIYGVKVHCALNTLIKESEIKAAVETAEGICRAGADAIIIQDLGLASHIKRMLPDIELHASTQMTVTSIEGVKALEDAGFDRVVLARELSLSEIERIAKAAKAEIEVFVHGAICMCYSGQCLMSSMLGGRSGNRGRCAQPCRLSYTLLEDGRECGSAHILSPKDMALIGHLKELESAGVTSLKIEGRLKSPEYVSAVTGIYRKYLDEARGKVSEKDMRELRSAFSRSGFTDGYLTGRLGADMMSHDNPANNSGSRFSAETKERASGKFVRKIPITVFASLRAGEPISVTAYDRDGTCVSCTGTVAAERAVKKPLDEERLKEQLSKLGSTPFEAEETCVEAEAGVTVPVKDINETRRHVCAALEDELARREPGRIIKTPFVFGTRGDVKEVYLTAEVMTAGQAEAAAATGAVRRIYAPADVCEKLGGAINGAELVTRTTDIYRPERICTRRVSVSSAAALRHYGDMAAYGDFRLNVYNSLTASFFGGLKSITLSPELNLREIRDIADHFSAAELEVIGYGYLPLMIMKNCPVKAMGRCAKHGGVFSLRDREKLEFRLLCGDGCRAVLLNSKPIYTADIMESIVDSKINSVRLNFTVENSGECGKIVSAYRAALDGRQTEPMKENTFTRGHLKRGVL